MDGISSVQPQSAFKLFGFLEWDRCLAPLSGLDKAMLNLIAIGLVLVFYAVVFIIGFFWVFLDTFIFQHRALTKENGMVQRIHNKFPQFIRKKTLEDLKSSGLELLLFVLEPLFYSVMQIFDCKRASENGQDVLLLNGIGGTACWQGAHIGIVVLASVIAFALLFILPGYVYVVIKRRFQGSAHGIGHVLTLSFKDKYPYWMLVVFYERMLLVVASVASESFGKLVHLWTMFFFFLTWLGLKQVNPYKYQIENLTASIAYICLLGVTALGMAKLAACRDSVFCTATYIPGFESYSFWSYTFVAAPAVVLALRTVIGGVWAVVSAYKTYKAGGRFSTGFKSALAVQEEGAPRESKTK